MSRFTQAILIRATLSTALCLAQNADPRQVAEQKLAAKLQETPNDISLLLQMGSMKMEDAGTLREASQRSSALDDARSAFERIAAIEPNNTAALYSLGVLGWMRVFPELRTARAQMTMEPEAPGPLRDPATRAVLNARFAQTIADALAYLQRVLVVDPQNNDSMAYLNLVYRAKADLEDTPSAAREDIAAADEWVHKALDTSRAKAASGEPPNPSFANAPPPPPPPPSPGGLPPAPAAIRVSGNVQAANLVQKVDPVYPELALKARIQGTVRFNATINRDGTVARLMVLSGHPLLVQSALEAARRWLYRPTLLNGSPVDVLTTIDINFTLPPGN